jgi:hypothetical protein
MNTRNIQISDQISGWVFNIHECGSELVTGTVIKIDPYDPNDWSYCVRDNKTGYTEWIYERKIVEHIVGTR